MARHPDACESENSFCAGFPVILRIPPVDDRAKR